jgi:potassium efflux system protein
VAGAGELLAEKAFHLVGLRVPFDDLVKAVVVLALGTWASFLLERGTRALARRRRKEAGFQSGLGRLVRYLGVLASGILALRVAGVQITVVMTVLVALGSALLVGLAFGLHNLTQNFVAGMMVLAEQPIRKGDFVEINGVEGTVLEVGLRASRVQTRDGAILVVPNGRWVTECVTNFSYPVPRQRWTVAVECELSEEPRTVQSLLGRVASGHPLVLRAPGPEVRLEEVLGGNLKFALQFWVENPLDGRRVSSDLRFSLVAACREAGIALAQPSLEVKFKPLR